MAMVLIVAAILVVAFVIIPLCGGAFLLLSSKIFRIENVTFGRAYLAYFAGYAAASVIGSAVMFLMVSLSGEPRGEGIIFWTALPLPQFLFLFAIAIGVHLIVVPLILKARHLRAVLAQGLAIVMNSVAFGVVLGLPLLLLLQSARTEARRVMAQNNLRQIGFAMHYHRDQHSEFPTAASYDEQGKPLLSWRVHMLPYLDQPWLYEQFHLDEPWDSPHNRELLQHMPDVYRSPHQSADDTSTHYQVFATLVEMPLPQSDGPPPWRHRQRAPFTLLSDSQPAPPGMLRSIPGVMHGIPYAEDGTANTFCVVESSTAVPWTKPADIAYDPKKPLPELGALLDGHFLAMLFDGSVHTVAKETPEEVLRAAVSHQGNETISIWDSLRD